MAFLTLKSRYHFAALILTIVGVFSLFCYQSLAEFARIYQNHFWRFKYEWIDGAKSLPYKSENGYTLYSTFFYPDRITTTKELPVVVYFFGGGWRKGSLNQFYTHAQYFTQKGFLTILVDYRVKLRHSSKPEESVADVADFLSYLTRNKEELNVDTASIFLCGASAGAQLALSALFSSSSHHVQPKGLILYSPVLNTYINGYAFDVLGPQRGLRLSPLHNMHQGMPPMIVFYGDYDEIIPPTEIELFKARADSLGVSVQLVSFADSGHEYPNGARLAETLLISDEFIEGIINMKP